MKALMLAVKSRLQTDPTLNYVRDCDIWVAENESLIPSEIKFPAIAIKDGQIKNEQKLCKNYVQEATVKIIVYQQILKSEEAITGATGILAMASDVIASLIDNDLSISGIQNIFPAYESESELFGDEEEMIQRKTVTIVYRRHRTWS